MIDDEQDSLEGEPAPTVFEKLLEGWSKIVSDQCFVVVFNAIPVEVGDAG